MPELSADYCDFPPNAKSNIKAAVLRDFEFLAEWACRGKKQQKDLADKEARERGEKGAGRTDMADAKAAP